MFASQITTFTESADPPRWVCLDAAALPYVDYTGAETVRQVQRALDDHGIRLVVAESMPDVSRQLDRYDLTDLLGADAIYPTIQDAVDAFQRQRT